MIRPTFDARPQPRRHRKLHSGRFDRSAGATSGVATRAWTETPSLCNLLRDAAGDGLFDVEIERLTRSHQYSLGNSAILITELTDEAGATLRITDFAPRFKHYERLARPTMLIRQIER